MRMLSVFVVMFTVFFVFSCYENARLDYFLIKNESVCTTTGNCDFGFRVLDVDTPKIAGYSVKIDFGNNKIYTNTVEKCLSTGFCKESNGEISVNNLYSSSGSYVSKLTVFVSNSDISESKEISLSIKFPTPCDGINCSQNGICKLTENNLPYCLCNDGFHAELLNCVANECVNDDISTQNCGLNGRGVQFKVCSNYRWGEWSDCADKDICVDESVETVSCGENESGVKERFCESGQWREPEQCSEKWSQITAGSNHNCGIKMSDNKLYCWGSNNTAQLGNGTKEDSATPIKVTESIEVKKVVQRTSEEINVWEKLAAGYLHTCGIKASDSKLYCWGNNYHGQLGINSECQASSQECDVVNPVQVGNEEWLDLSAGYYHACGIKKSDNKVYCWGSNSYGQLGDGSYVKKGYPIPINTDKTSWTKLSSKSNHSCAIASDDQKLYCWGENTYGELGDGTNVNLSIPTQIGLDSWYDIVLGKNHICGIKFEDKSLYCWGFNDFGQLGDGTYEGKTFPTKVLDNGLAWEAVFAGEKHTCAITDSDKMLYCWGDNSWGQLGDGTAISKNVPVMVGTEEDNWGHVAIGENHSCGIKLDDNKLYCWGYNGNGQLGGKFSQTDRTIRFKLTQSI